MKPEIWGRFPNGDMVNNPIPKDRLFARRWDEYRINNYGYPTCIYNINIKIKKSKNKTTVYI